MATPEATTKKAETPFQIVVADLKRHEQQITSVLPRHVPSDKFNRILIAVLSTSPELVKAATASPDARNSLNREVMKAAQDGLVLDGREAALVKFVVKKKDEKGNDKYVDELKYMPMVQGVLKRMRNSGEIASIECEVVYQNDFFDIEKGDNAYLKHRPWYVREDENITEPGAIRLAYVSALLKDGTRVREVINKFDVAQLKASSRSKDKQGNLVGPWKTWESEMWRKSVLHRAAKYLPKSSDKENGADVVSLLDRDNELYDVVDSETGEVTQERKPRAPKPAADPKPSPKMFDGEASEVVEPKPEPKPTARPPAKPANGSPPAQRRSAAQALGDDPVEDASSGEFPEDGDGDEDLI